MKTEQGAEFIDRNIGMVIRGLAVQGFLSEMFLDRLKEAGGGEISLKAVRKVVQNRELCSNEVYDLANLFEITVETFQYFISEEQRDVLKAMLREPGKDAV